VTSAGAVNANAVYGLNLAGGWASIFKDGATDITFSTAYGMNFVTGTSANDDSLHFKPNGVERLVVSESGNVGVGSSSPNALFTVQNVGTGYTAIFEDQAGDTTPVFISSGGVLVAGYTDTVGSGAMQSGDTNGGVFEAFRVDSTTVAGDRIGTFSFGTTDGSRSGIASIRGLAAEAISAGTEGSHLTFLTTPIGAGTALEQVRITSAGFVGIGTTTPNDRLQVFGDIRVGTTGTNGCIKDYAGTALTGVCSSDERLKTNVVDLSDGYLDRMNNLRLITYNWNEQANTLNKVDQTVTNYGLLAQNVEAYFPELVTVDSNGYKQVNYSRLPLYLLKAVQELGKKVASLSDYISTKEIKTNKLCVEDVCVTKEQFRMMIQNSNITPTISTPTVPTPDPVVVPDPTDEVVPEPESVVVVPTPEAEETPVVVESTLETPVDPGENL
jgi:hypothetical protein